LQPLENLVRFFIERWTVPTFELADKDASGAVRPTQLRLKVLRHHLRVRLELARDLGLDDEGVQGG
jgi:hypothetical protein